MSGLNNRVTANFTADLSRQQVGLQVICFARFDEDFYRRQIESLLDFVRPSAESLDLTLYIFMHGMCLSTAFQEHVFSITPFHAHFSTLRHTFKHSRSEGGPSTYYRDVNELYYKSLAVNRHSYIFHLDGDVMPCRPRFIPKERDDLLSEWIQLIEDPAIPYVALCNIGSSYYEAGTLLRDFYRPFYYRDDKQTLLFSTQSFFAPRYLLLAPSPPEVPLELWVTEKIRVRELRTLNLCARDEFLWRHYLACPKNG
jgi:hypothetical protein